MWRRERLYRATGLLTRRETEAAGAALLELQRGLTGSRARAGSFYMEDRELFGAYLLYYWPVSYMQVSLALAELRLEPRSVLDLGSGPGPASAAIIDALAETNPAHTAEGPGGGGLEELVLVDGSARALDAASTLLAPTLAGALRPSTLVANLESGAELPEGPFDLVVTGHCLNELWIGRDDAIARRARLLEMAAARLTPGGAILVLEPALLSTSRELLELRDLLASRGWALLGPCPGSYPCPALAAGSERSCHCLSSWRPPAPVAQLAAAAGLDRGSVKFSYIALSPNASTSVAPGGRGSPSWRRVVSDPMLNKAGRLRYLLCGEGRLETLSAAADDEAARRQLFMSLARGDIVELRGAEPRPGGGFGLGPRSELAIRARAPEAAS